MTCTFWKLFLDWISERIGVAVLFFEYIILYCLLFQTVLSSLNLGPMFIFVFTAVVVLTKAILHLGSQQVDSICSFCVNHLNTFWNFTFWNFTFWNFTFWNFTFWNFFLS